MTSTLTRTHCRLDPGGRKLLDTAAGQIRALRKGVLQDPPGCPHRGRPRRLIHRRGTPHSRSRPVQGPGEGLLGIGKGAPKRPFSFDRFELPDNRYPLGHHRFTGIDHNAVETAGNRSTAGTCKVPVQRVLSRGELTVTKGGHRAAGEVEHLNGRGAGAAMEREPRALEPPGSVGSADGGYEGGPPSPSSTPVPPTSMEPR